MAEPEQTEPLKPGQVGFINPPLTGPSTVHPEQREFEAPENWPHSVPVVTERISNSYFGNVVDQDFTERHGVLYSVAGKPFDSHGSAIAWCVKNPKSAQAATEAVEGRGPPMSDNESSTAPIETAMPSMPVVETHVPEPVVEPAPASIVPLEPLRDALQSEEEKPSAI